MSATGKVEFDWDKWSVRIIPENGSLDVVISDPEETDYFIHALSNIEADMYAGKVTKEEYDRKFDEIVSRKIDETRKR